MKLQNTENATREQENVQILLWKAALGPWKSGVLPNGDNLDRARASLPNTLPSRGIGVRQHHQTRRG